MARLAKPNALPWLLLSVLVIALDSGASSGC